MTPRPAIRTAAALVVFVSAVSGLAPPAQAGAFVPGTGTSSADVARLVLHSAGLSVGVGIGKTRAQFAGAQGNAEAAGVDVGSLDTLSKAPVACGASLADLAPAGSAPGRVVVSSGQGRTTRHAATAGAGTPLEVLSQTGSAAPDASAAARVDGVRFEVPGVVTVLSGSAASAAELTPRTARAARAASRIGTLVLGGGLVRLDDLGWGAHNRTGQRPADTAGFTVGALTVAGRTQPVAAGAPATAEAIAAANAVLAPLGLALHPPTVVAAETGTSVSPLRISITATPQLRALLAPTLEAVQPFRTGLLSFVRPLTLGPDCGLATALGFGYLLADLATVALGEQGRIDLDLGGARAGTDDTVYANPFASGFGALNPLGPPGAPARPTAADAGPPGGTAPGASPSAGSATTTARPAGGAGGSGVVAGAIGLSPIALVCRSAHLSGDGCARRGGVLAGTLMLLVVGVLAGADRIRARRT